MTCVLFRWTLRRVWREGGEGSRFGRFGGFLLAPAPHLGRSQPSKLGPSELSLPLFLSVLPKARVLSAGLASV